MQSKRVDRTSLHSSTNVHSRMRSHSLGKTETWDPRPVADRLILRKSSLGDLHELRIAVEQWHSTMCGFSYRSGEWHLAIMS